MRGRRGKELLKMFNLQGLGSLAILLSVLGFTSAQFGTVCDHANLCQNGATRCFNRPLEVNAPVGTLPYICDCTGTGFIGQRCSDPPPTYRSDRPDESFITCYGIDCRTGMFQSLNYPNLYEDRWTAIYLLYIPGATRIDFQFTGSGGFGIETFKDELYVGSGTTFSSADFQGEDLFVGDRVVRFYDNTTLLGGQLTFPPPFSIDSDTVWLYFLTDKNIMYNGWQLRWNAAVDSQPPIVVRCPSNIVRTLERGQPQFLIIDWQEPIANDPSTPVTTVASHDSGDAFFIGTTTVSYSFFDRFGNEAVCSFDVIIIEADTQPPIISNCPDPITRQVELGITTLSVSWAEPSATDVGPVTLADRSHQPGSSFPAPSSLGTISRTNVIYTFSDDNDNRATCAFTVSISAVDTTPPTISGCPENLFDTVEIGTNGVATVIWAEPTATDLSNTASLQDRSHSPGTQFPAGNTQVTYVFGDASGNQATCQFNVFVSPTDTQPPRIQGCIPVVTGTVELGTPGAIVEWTEPTAIDLSGQQVTVTTTRQPNSFFTVGSTEVTYTFSDPSGNSDSCVFQVIVTEVDTVAPTIVGCPTVVTEVIELGVSRVEVFWNAPTANDLSEPPPVSVANSANPGDIFPPGETQVVYTFTDSSGNFADCTFTVQVTERDTVPPTIVSCPNDQTRVIELGGVLPTVFWAEPIATDASGVTNIISESHQIGTPFPIGRTTVTYQIADASGNVAVCSFFVLVTQEDTVPPTITGCPNDIFETVELGTQTFNVFWTEPTATDESGSVQLSDRSHAPGSPFPVDQFPATVVMYQFTDGAGNVAQCTFTVRVTSVDTTPPFCENNPADMVQMVELGNPGVPVSWTPPTCNDLSGTAFLTGATHQPSSFFPADSTTTVIHTCQDQAGNEGTCSFVIFIQEVDTTPPSVVQGVDSINQFVELGDNGATITWQEPTSTDLSGTQTLISRSHTPNTRFPLGETTVSYLFGDATGNTATYTFCVSVSTRDTVAPVIQGCPEQGVTVTVELGETSGVAIWAEPTANDLSGVVTLDRRTAAPGDRFNLGQTTVMYFFTDSSSNTATCTFTVTVTPVDTMPPDISGCPTVIRETVELGITRRVVFFTEPTATDVSGVVTVTRTHNPGDSFPVGTTSVTYTFTDATGNSDVCTFVVNVAAQDTTPPQCVDLPQNVGSQVELGSQGAVVTWTPPTCSDNGVAFVSSSTHRPNTFFMVNPEGTLVTYTCQDNSGLTTDCSFRVSVTTIDTTRPMCENVPNNPSATVELATVGGAVVSWTEPQCVDLSPTNQVTSHNPGSFFLVGATEVTYTCTDTSGNSFSCPFTVTVVEVDSTDPICVNLPQDITEIVELGTPVRTVTWNEPTCSDASGNPTQTSTARPGDTFVVGNTPVTYTCRDNAGNVGTCTFTVSVTSVDRVPPEIIGCPNPGDITSVVELGISQTIVFWPEPTATDASGVATIAQRSHQPGSSFPVGDTQVMYVFSDPSGNTGVCQFVVSVTTVDTTPPVVANCPNEASSTVELGLATGRVFWAEPTATDLSGTVTLTSRSHTPGSEFPVGQTEVTYTFSDASGNIAVCRIVVTVSTEDTTRPVISGCPSNVVEVVELGQSGATVFWTEPSATDASGVAILSAQTAQPGSFFQIGNDQVSYTYVDSSGNEAVCVFTVTVSTVDSTPPTFSIIPEDITESVELGQPGRTVSWPAVECEDLSGVAFVTQSTHMPGGFFPVGETTVTYTCSDNAGNSAQESFVVRVIEVDTIPPTFTVIPDVVTEVVELGQPGGSVNWPDIICDDLSGVAFVTQSSHQPGAFFLIGDTTVTYTCSDNSGNSASMDFIVRVVELDRTDPVCVGLPPGASGTAEIGGVPGSMVSWPAPTCSDLSATTITSTHMPGDFFPIGSTTVTYTCTDAANNMGSCSFEVTVSQVDTTPPECTNLPSDITRFVELGETGAPGVTWREPVCTDASNTGRVLTSTSTPPAFFPVGETMVTYTCTDDASLTSTCSFNVIIQTRDTVPPEINGCPDNQEITVELGVQSSQAFWVIPTATDISGQPALISSTHQPGASFNVGQTTIMYVFADQTGNQATCEFTVTITPVDTTPPNILGCPFSSITETIELGTPGIVVTWEEPTASDLSGTAILTDRTHQPNTFFPTGVTEVTYTFSDLSGLSATCSFMVVVNTVDTTPPTITNCPADRAVTIELGEPGSVISWVEPTATDESGIASLVTRSHDPDSLFLVGDTTVTYVFQDNSNNRETCTFRITVTPRDTAPPIVSNTPADITRVVELGEPGINVAWTEPTATDVSGTATLENRSHQPGDFFPVGQTTVSYTFVDASNNRATVSFTVTVTEQDRTPPTISNCPTNNVVASVELGNTGTTVTWLEPTATDISGTAALSSRSHTPLSFFQIGATTVMYVFTDMTGNTATCRFCVSIEAVDSIAPTCQNLPQNVFETVEVGMTSILVNWVEPTCLDEDFASVTMRSQSSPALFPADTTTEVTFTCTDRTGNQAMCSFSVTVTAIDTVAPTISNTPEDITRIVELGEPGTTVTWIEPTATDASGTAVLESRSHQPGDFFPVGETPVTYTFVDASGNRATMTFTVTVTPVDTIPPTISNTPADITRMVELGEDGTNVGWVEPTATDISGTAVLESRTHQPNDFFPLGTTTVRYTYVDASGNRADTTFTVTVTPVDRIPPTISNTPQPITEFVELGETGRTVLWTEPTATDLSGTAVLESRTHRPGEFFPVGTTSVTYVFVDASGNRADTTFPVTVTEVDTTPPTVQCPQPVRVPLELGSAGTTATWTEPTATDLSGNPRLDSRSTLPGSFFTETTTVEYVFSDVSGNTVTCRFCVMLVFEDTTPPQCVDLPNPILEVIELGDQGMQVNWAPPSCTDISGTAFITQSTHQPGAFFPVGTTQVTYTCTDGAGLDTTCSFPVTVNEMDTIPPSIICPDDVTITVEIRSGGATATWIVPMATDRSGQTTVSSQFSPGDFFPTGTTPVTYSAIDPAGNVGTCTFDVIVREVDSIPPMVMAPPDITRVIEINTGPVSITFPPPVVSDNSLQTPILVDQSHQSGDLFPVGTTTVTFTYADQAGNRNSDSFTITVIEMDTINPVISGCPGSITETTSLEAQQCRVPWEEPMVTDNSGVVTLFDRSHTPNSLFPAGDTTVTYTYSDPTGNQAFCTFVITCTPVDEVLPVVICPPNQQSETTLEIPFCTIGWEDPQASDNSGNVFLVSQTHQPLASQFVVGDTTVTYTYRDPSNNEGTCSFTVTCIEVDRIPPVVVCPQDVSVTIIEGLPGTTVFFNQPTATDNSGIATITGITQDSNSFFAVGQTTVVATATDDVGNTDQCSFNVFIQEGNPCEPNPCNNGGFCAIDSLNMFTCVCTECFNGRTCDNPINACVNNQCQNGAACVAAEGACDSYRCECPPCYSGEFCQDFRDSCENHQCQGGATCCPDDNCLTYSCQCPPCFEGPYCEQAIQPCEVHNCRNSAQCIPDPLGDCSGYTCSCTGCFDGRFCEQPMNPCEPNPCGNNGFCTPDPTDCYRYTCQCVGCFTGNQCEIQIQDTCLTNPCLNGATCRRLGSSCTSYTCDCPKGFLGILCEQSQVDNTNPCQSFPCDNGATCVESGSNYICMCRSGYAGVNCADAIASPPQFQLACASNPCSGNSQCFNSFHSTSNNFLYQPQYSCQCSNQFTGQNCQDFVGIGVSFCNPSPCANSGTCTNAFHSFMNEVDYVCTCPVGFRGQDCESDVGNPCGSSPCENGGTCIPFSTYFTCTCLAGFSGNFCQTPTGAGPQITVTSCPSDITLNNQGPATWTEPRAFGGVGDITLAYQSHSPGDFFSSGETPVSYVFSDSSRRFAECNFFVIVRSTVITNRCSPNPCSNGGRCLQSGAQLCDCTGTGFTGTTCITAVTNRCSPNPCSNGGRCLQTGAQLCDCTGTGFTGATCTTATGGRTVTCPPDIVATSDGGDLVITWTAPVTPLDIVLTSQTHRSGDTFGVGSTEVTYNYFDTTNGQQLSCSFTITVSAGPCPADISMTTNQQLTSVSWTEEGAGTDYFITQRSHQSGDVFPAGLTTVTLTYFNLRLSQPESCSFTINLMQSGLPVDTVAPEITFCPPGTTFDRLPQAAAGLSIAINWDEPRYDDEGGTVQVTQSHTSGDSFPVGQDTVVTYTVTDAAGNSATCDFTISLQLAARKKRDVEIEGVFYKNDSESCPCLNGGDCITLAQQTTFCQCPHGYSGIICEVPQGPYEGDSALQMPFVVMLGFLVVIIAILATALCLIASSISNSKRTPKGDEVPIIN